MVNNSVDPGSIDHRTSAGFFPQGEEDDDSAFNFSRRGGERQRIETRDLKNEKKKEKNEQIDLPPRGTKDFLFICYSRNNYRYTRRNNANRPLPAPLTMKAISRAAVRDPSRRVSARYHAKIFVPG